MKMFIPPLDSVIKLSDDWKFLVNRNEYNVNFLEMYYSNPNCLQNDFDKKIWGWYVTLPVNTELKLIKINFRSCSKNIDNFYFRVMNNSSKHIKFYVSASDFNNMEIYK